MESFTARLRGPATKILSILQGNTELTLILQIHAILLKTPLYRNNYVLAKFLRRCFSKSSQQHLAYARLIFDEIQNPDAFIWNLMIRAYLQSEHYEECISLFYQMHLFKGVRADSFSFSLVLQACGRFPDFELGINVHNKSLKFGFGSDLFVQTALLEMYAKSGRMDFARQVFDEMTERDLTSYNVLLAEYARCGDINSARQLFDNMSERDSVSWNTMIHGYAAYGDLGSARLLFDQNEKKDLVSWSSMISAYAQSRLSNESLRLFNEMMMSKVKPDNITMMSVLSACGEIGALGTGKMVHRYIARNQINLDVKVGTSLVDMYAKCGDIENSLEVFHKMQEKDALAWSMMIMGLAKHGLADMALDLFTEMISEGLDPNDITFVGVLSACSHAGLVDKGKTYFASMNSVYGIKPKIEHYGCMIDLLGRAGQLKEGRELISNMPFEPDAVTWRALLGACKIHKDIELAQEAMNNLLELEPDVEGHYILLSNIYAQAKKWDQVSNIRRKMKAKNIQKMPGSSSIEIDNAVHEFVSGDMLHPKSKEIYTMLAEIIGRLLSHGYKPMTFLVLQDIDEKEKEIILAHHSEKLAIAFGLLSTSPRTPIRIVKNLRVCEDCHLVFKLLSSIYSRQLIVRDRNRFHHFADGSCSCNDYW